ncbi:MAG: type II toxin-antitoxin system VapC family toxin, partial [Geminicoccaceae bacterium]|nr:type II toxin-antitoxin system VapC family toxin [Geminicoccaceae bacterium]
VDTSALVAILRKEPEGDVFLELINDADICRISAATLLESVIVIDNRVSVAAGRELDLLIFRAGIVIEPVTEAQVAIARQAYLAFGRGNHPASLNFGNCFAYALSMDRGEPLLFKGNDFSQTDVRPAL